MRVIGAIVGVAVVVTAFLYLNPVYLSDSTASLLSETEENRRDYPLPSVTQVCSFMERGFSDGISGTGSANRNQQSAKSMALSYDVTEDELMTMYWRGVNYGKGTMANYYDVTERREKLELACAKQAGRILEDKATKKESAG